VNHVITCMLFITKQKEMNHLLEERYIYLPTQTTNITVHVQYNVPLYI